MRVAAAAYPPERLAGWDAYVTKVTAWVAGGVGQGAELLVFPEYALIEPALAALHGTHASEVPIPELFAAGQDLWGPVADFWAGLARNNGVHILAGSGPAEGPTGPVNRALLVTPYGAVGTQDKLIPTPWERAQTPLVAGVSQTVFDTAIGRIGVLVCYDSEFPLNSRALIEGGADLILIPACTDALSGACRVDIAARARALEGRVPTVMSMTVGSVPGCQLVDTNVGWAGIFGPPDFGWPDTGVIACGQRDVPGWVVADLPEHEGDSPRAVDIPAHWPEQAVGAATLKRL